MAAHTWKARRCFSTLQSAPRLPVAGLSRVAGDTSSPLRTETLGRALDKVAEAFPDRPALTCSADGDHMTYGELQRRVDALAAALTTLAEPGDRVGLMAHSQAEWVLLQWATAKSGTILVNINPAYRPNELRFAVEAVGCSVLAVSREAPLADTFEATAGADVGLPSVRHLLSLSGPDDVLPAATPVSELVAAFDGSDLHMARHPVRDDVVNIQFTSGTTGRPKGASLTHTGILNNGWFVGETLRLTADDVFAVPPPMYHCFGSVLGVVAGFTHGCHMVFPCRRFDPDLTLQACADEGVTVLHGVPTMFIAMLACDTFPRVQQQLHLRTGIMAGSSAPVELLRRVKDPAAGLGMDGISVAYGMTETSPVSFQVDVDDDDRAKTETVGRVHPHVTCKIVDEEGRTVPVGTPGELWTAGYCVMQGYWNNPEGTSDAITPDGWMRTGDLCVMDDDGYVSVVGRLKDVIIRGGENLFPVEIEDVLYQLHGVRQAQVVGVPSRRLGEVVVAVIVRQPGVQLSEEDVQAHVSERLARFKTPAYVVFRDEATAPLPMTVTGKVQKHLLAAEVQTQLFGEGGSAP